jgi:hypothetical protein
MKEMQRAGLDTGWPFYCAVLPHASRFRLGARYANVSIHAAAARSIFA